MFKVGDKLKRKVANMKPGFVGKTVIVIEVLGTEIAVKDLVTGKRIGEGIVWGSSLFEKVQQRVSHYPSWW